MVQAVDAPADSVETAVLAMEAAAGAPVEVTRSPVTDLVSFLATGPGHPIRLDVPASAPASERALAFLAAYGKALGISDPSKVRVLRATPKDQVGMEHVRLQQLHKGIPVAAGELTVHLRGARLVSVLAKTLPDPADVEITPEIGAGEAGAIVSKLLEEKRFIKDAAISTPRLEILNKGLVEGGSSPSRLAWFLVASKVDLREYFWVDAARGAILLTFSQRPEARNRQIHDTANSNVLPGTLVRAEGSPPTGDPDSDRAYDFSGDTYDYFFNEHGRDSFDGSGAVIRSTVRFCPSLADCPHQNAFWNGDQVVYGEGFPLADDVDAHELTHAVTDFSADLFFYMQSGALNESFSDIFGETVDLTNGGGTDTAAVRWLVGEDLPGGALRNMMNPNAFGDPGKISDPEFRCLSVDFDQGGVHHNSGVPNHAYALMVDGGTFNGRTVTGIGLAKAGRIQYRTLTSYLTNGSNFLDNYRSLQQSCSDLIGAAGITAADCVSVKDALDAVEMSQAICAIPGEPEPCPAGQTRTDLFFDGLEAGGGNFVSQTAQGSSSWFVRDFFAKTGVLHLDNEPQTSGATDSSVAMNLNVPIPASGARMQFSHVWEFERETSAFFDGAVVELSTNSGASWSDVGSLIIAGAPYNGTISSAFGNPLGGRAAFVGASFGYTATQLDLSSLAGQNTRFRWRFGADSSVGSFGSSVDDVAIYRCGSPPTPPASPITCNGLPATMVGSDGGETMGGTPGRDVIHGRGGNDVIRGNGGNDVICGGAGKDRLFGGPGQDRLFGGPGRDVLNGGTGRDRCNGGSRADTAAKCERNTRAP